MHRKRSRIQCLRSQNRESRYVLTPLYSHTICQYSYVLVNDRVALAANLPVQPCAHSVRGTCKSLLRNQRSINIHGRFGPVVLHPVLPLRSKHIETDAVRLRIDQLEQLPLECRELPRIYFALEDRVLDALSPIEARLCHLRKPLPTFWRGGRDIVCDEDEHARTSGGLLPDERGISIQVATDEACEQTRLEMHEQAYRGPLAQEGVNDRFLLSSLVGRDDFFAG